MWYVMGNSKNHVRCCEIENFVRAHVCKKMRVPWCEVPGSAGRLTELGYRWVIGQKIWAWFREAYHILYLVIGINRSTGRRRPSIYIVQQK